jgi:hypothetical protein
MGKAYQFAAKKQSFAFRMARNFGQKKGAATCAAPETGKNPSR